MTALADDQLAAGGTLEPGQWTPTGWGVQHRVRCSDDNWTELVCHTRVRPEMVDKYTPGPNHRCPTDRIDTRAVERERCARCAALPDLGPMQPAPEGEVRRSPDGRLVAVCVHHDHDAGRGWRVVGDSDPAPHMHFWRSDWEVVDWVPVGNVHELVES